MAELVRENEELREEVKLLNFSFKYDLLRYFYISLKTMSLLYL